MKRIINIYKLILPYLFNTSKVRIATLLTLTFIMFDIAATTSFPYIWKSIIAAPQDSTLLPWFLSMTLLMFIVWTLKKTSIHLKKIAFFPVTNEAIKDIRFRTILKVHSLKLKELENYDAQEVISATNRVSQSIRNFMCVSFISVFPSITKIIVLSIALITTDVKCALIAIFAIAGLMAASFYLKHYSAAKRKGWHLTDNVTIAMGHSLYNTTSVRFNLSEESNKLENLFNLEANAWQQHNNAEYILHLLQDVIFYIGAFAGFSLLMIQYANGLIDLPKLVLVYGIIGSMYHPLLEISRNLTRFFGGIIDLNKTLNILETPSEVKPLQITSNIPQPIILKDVSFNHIPNKAILNKINLTITPGDKIGIFGPSGTGKSTLCKMIAGLIDPTDGTVSYGQLPLNKINTQSLGNILWYIPQEQGIKDFEQHQHEFGVNLKQKPSSGGEYQRYLLNQALKRKPKIIILDETTNALDKVSLDLIMEHVLETIPTVIMITHRQNTLSKMTRIVELKDGHLKEITTKSEKLIGA